jgi:hypothetical protein
LLDPFNLEMKYSTLLFVGLGITYFSTTYAQVPVNEIPSNLLELAASDYNAVSGEISFKLNGTTLSPAMKKLWFTVHNLSAPGQLKVQMTNDASPAQTIIPEFAINNSTTADSLLVLTPEVIESGGVGGGMHTQRFGIDLRANGAPTLALNQIYKLKFTFTPASTSDTSAVRILSLYGYDTADTNRVTAVTASPSSTYSGGVVADGKVAWETASLNSRPNGVTLLARCSDCHVLNGGDLSYFGYSTNSIYKRSRWHGLSDIQAKNIVAYIGSLSTDTRWKKKSNPWDPPYQPGDNVTASEVEWAKGAGIKSVLPHDIQMLNKLFIDGTDAGTKAGDSLDEIQAAFNKDAGDSASTAMKVPNIPVAVQMPDWNRWLPKIHPKDVWTEAPALNSSPSWDKILGRYRAARNFLSNGGHTSGAPTVFTDTEKKNLVSDLSNMEKFSRDLVSQGLADNDDGGAWRKRRPLWIHDGNNWIVTMIRRIGGKLGKALPTSDNDIKADTSDDNPYARMAREGAKRGLASWIGVKHFEIMHGYKLQDSVGNENMLAAYEKVTNPSITSLPVVVERYAWPLVNQSVFANAPHITADTIIAWDYPFSTKAMGEGILELDRQSGYYQSVAWYHMQLILNSGQRAKNTTVQPLDWQYQFDNIHWLAQDAPTHRYPLLLAMTYAKMQQVKDTGDLIYGGMMRIALPRWSASDLLGDPILFEPFSRVGAGGVGDDSAYTNLWRNLNLVAIENFLAVYTNPNLKIKWDEPDNYYGDVTRTKGNFVNRDPDNLIKYSVNLPRFGDPSFPFNDGYLKVEKSTSSITTSIKQAPPNSFNANQSSALSNGFGYLDQDRISNAWRYLELLTYQFSSLPKSVLSTTDTEWAAGTAGDLSNTSGGILWRLEEWCRLTWPGPNNNLNNWHP